MTAPATLAPPSSAPSPESAPDGNGYNPFLGEDNKNLGEQITLSIFIVLPLVAVLAAGFVAWGWGLSYRDVVIALVMYAISGHGITVGFHRYFTHGSFKAK